MTTKRNLLSLLLFLIPFTMVLGMFFLSLKQGQGNISDSFNSMEDLLVISQRFFSSAIKVIKSKFFLHGFIGFLLYSFTLFAVEASAYPLSQKYVEKEIDYRDVFLLLRKRVYILSFLFFMLSITGYLILDKGVLDNIFREISTTVDSKSSLGDFLIEAVWQAYSTNVIFVVFLSTFLFTGLLTADFTEAGVYLIDGGLDTLTRKGLSYFLRREVFSLDYWGSVFLNIAITTLILISGSMFTIFFLCPFLGIKLFVFSLIQMIMSIEVLVVSILCLVFLFIGLYLKTNFCKGL